MWPFDTITEKPHANRTGTRQLSPHPLCAARVVVDEPLPRHPRHLQLKLTLRVIHVHTIASIRSELDVMDASTTRTLQRVRCVQAVVIGAGISIE